MLLTLEGMDPGIGMDIWSSSVMNVHAMEQASGEAATIEQPGATTANPLRTEKTSIGLAD